MLQQRIEPRAKQRLALVAPQRIGIAKHISIAHDAARQRRLARIEATPAAASPAFDHERADFSRLDDVNLGKHNSLGEPCEVCEGRARQHRHPVLTSRLR